jgi:O-antigen/teichoic acid export membrane protein
VSTPPDAVRPPADPVAEEQVHHGNQFTKILRHGAWYFLASVLTKAAGIVLVPIYTQYLSPSEYGILGSLDAIARLLPLFMSFYLDAAFIRYYYGERAASRERVKTLYSTQFWFVAVWGSIVVLIGMLVAPVTIEPLVGVPFVPYVPLVLVGPLFLQLGVMGSQLMRAELRARQVSLISLASFAATAVVSLVLLIPFDQGVVSLLWGLAVGPFVAFAAFTIIALREGYLGWSFEWATLRRGLRFSIPLIPNLAGAWISGFSNRLVIAHYGTNAEVGLFTIAVQLGFVIYFVNDAITQVQGPIGMSAMTEDTTAGKRQMSEFVSVFVWSMLLVYLALTLFAEEILEVLTAPAYHSAYTLVGIIALAYAVAGLYRVFTTVLSYHNRLWVISTGAVLSALLSVVALFAFVPTYGADAAAWSFLGSVVLYTAWLAWFSQRTDPIPLNWPLLIPVVALATATIAGYLVVEEIDPGAVVAIAVKAALLVMYAGAIFVLPPLAPLRAGVMTVQRGARDRLRRSG